MVFGLHTVQPKQVAVTDPAKRIKGTVIDFSKVTQLSWHPRVFYYKGFLSDEACQHIVDIGACQIDVVNIPWGLFQLT
jgi:hypothetical protein